MPDYKYRKALVSRIVKAVKTPFEDALRKESELWQKPFEKELADLDNLLENSLLSRRDSEGVSYLNGAEVGSIQPCLPVRGGSSTDYQVKRNRDDESTNDVDMHQALVSAKEGISRRQRPTPDSMPISNGPSENALGPKGFGAISSHLDDDAQDTELLTPPLSSGGSSQPMLRGGIPWYMDPFDPVGTTIQEERWTGRELVRSMSEELSDMDEEELSGLVDADEAEAEAAPDSANDIAAELAAKAKAKKRKTANARRRRPWG